MSTHHRPFRSVLGSLVRSVGCVGFVTIVALGASAACSSTGELCIDSQCAAGNRCLPLNGQVKCRKTCSSNINAAESCPYGYSCTDTLTGAPPFCVAIEAKSADGRLVQKAAGQWGQQCQPNLGLENVACDTAQGFLCYAQSPTDASAYCTRYDCTKDEECGPGFWCGKINVTPSAVTAKRTTIGEVQSVCLKREYCATCRADLDCLPVKGRGQRCIIDASGAGVCAPECDDSSNCPDEARCADVGLVKADESGPQLVCYPRATVCVGDGSLCSPCRVDTDCGEDGICLGGEYTSEKACAKKVDSCAACPKTIASPARQIGCSTGASELVPKNYCLGLLKVGTVSNVGCWTPDQR